MNQKKTWNVRDQTKTELENLLMKTYKEIKATYKQAQQAAKLEDAEYYIEIAFRKKALASEIECELYKRECLGEWLNEAK
nr:hypothetical protein DXGOKGYL_DXGOKGYL_CDS_0007 [Microvirus sp.]